MDVEQDLRQDLEQVGAGQSAGGTLLTKAASTVGTSSGGRGRDSRDGEVGGGGIEREMRGTGGTVEAGGTAEAAEGSSLMDD